MPFYSELFTLSLSLDPTVLWEVPGPNDHSDPPTLSLKPWDSRGWTRKQQEGETGV